MGMVLLKALFLAAAVQLLHLCACQSSDSPFGSSLQYQSISSCAQLLDVVRPSPGVFPYSYKSPLYRSGSVFGSRYYEQFNIFSPIFISPRPFFIQPGQPIDLIDSGAIFTGQVQFGGNVGSAAIAVNGIGTTAASESSAASVSNSVQFSTTAVTSSGLSLPDPIPEFSETNNQIEGIDEADIVKTDGKRIYAIGGHTLLIYNAFSDPDSPNPKKLGTVNLENYLDAGGFIPLPDDGSVSISASDSRLAYGGKKTFAASDILIEGDKVLVIGQARQVTPVKFATIAASLGWPLQVRTMNTVIMLVLDAGATPASPKLVKFHEIEGTYVTARKTGGKAYLVLGQAPFLDRPTSFNLKTSIANGDDFESSDVLPVYRGSASGSFVPITQCTDVGFIPGLFYQSLVTVASIDMISGAWGGASSQLGPWTAGSPAVVAYEDGLYIGLSWEQTQPWYNRFSGSSIFFPSFFTTRGTVLLAFNLSAGKVTFRSLGQAPGRLLNQYSMDEYDGHLRVAITTDGFTGTTSNAVYIFNKSTMKYVGSVKNLAPGESIYAARFIQDRAYIVTFRQIDPLFVIGLDPPSSPKVLGELKIPGFSDYLHPAGPNKLLGFGKGGTDSGLVTGLKVALFDVTNPAQPKEQGVLEIGGPGSTSEILTDPKALLYQATTGGGWFVLPVDLSSNLDNCLYGSSQNFQDKPRTPAYLGSYLVKLNSGAANSVDVFDVVHQISHVLPSNNLGNPCNFYCGSAVVKRALYVGDVLYTFSDQQIVATPLSEALAGGQPDPVWTDKMFTTTVNVPNYLDSACSVYP